MNWAVLLVFGAGVAVLLTAAFLAGGSARFWWELGGIVWREAMPRIGTAWVAYKTRHTPAEWKKVRAKWDRRQEMPGGGITTGKTIHQHTPPIPPTAK